MKKYIYAYLVLFFCMVTPAYAALKEVVKEISGTGPTQQQAIAQALLTAVQSVNGTSVYSRVDYQSTVKMSISRSEWNYKSQVSPIFSVDTTGSGSVSRYQVLSLTGSPNNYRAKVRVYVNKFESSLKDQHMNRIAILPFRVTRGASYDSEFSSELADLVGTHITQSGKLSVLDRQYLSEMQQESDFLNWDGAPQELARLGQKVGIDYLVVGKITQIAQTSQSMYGMNNNAEQIRLTWRVIEANTSKVAAAGTLNKTFSSSGVQNLVSGQETTIADHVAQELYQDILIALKLQTGKTSTSSVDSSSGFDMTPGSSDKPIQW